MELADDVHNRSPLVDRQEHARLLQKRMMALEKKNKKWAAIMGLLVTGSVTAAMALAKANNTALSKELLKASKAVGGFLATSQSGPIRALRWYAGAMRNMIIGSVYSTILFAPLTLAHRYIAQPRSPVAVKRNTNNKKHNTGNKNVARHRSRYPV
jgi:hypothetical protein